MFTEALGTSQTFSCSREIWTIEKVYVANDYAASAIVCLSFNQIIPVLTSTISLILTLEQGALLRHTVTSRCVPYGELVLKDTSQQSLTKVATNSSRGCLSGATEDALYHLQKSPSLSSLKVTATSCSI